MKQNKYTNNTKCHKEVKFVSVTQVEQLAYVLLTEFVVGATVAEYCELSNRPQWFA